MRKADNLPPYRAVVMKSGSLNFLEPSGPAQACYGITFLLLYVIHAVKKKVAELNRKFYKLCTVHNIKEHAARCANG